MLDRVGLCGKHVRYIDSTWTERKREGCMSWWYVFLLSEKFLKRFTFPTNEVLFCDLCSGVFSLSLFRRWFEKSVKTVVEIFPSSVRFMILIST